MQSKHCIISFIYESEDRFTAAKCSESRENQMSKATEPVIENEYNPDM